MTSNDLKRRQMTSKDDDKTFSEKKTKTRKTLKGGDTNEDIIHGRDLIEPIFSSTKMAEFMKIFKKKILIYKMKCNKQIIGATKNNVQRDLE